MNAEDGDFEDETDVQTEFERVVETFVDANVVVENSIELSIVAVVMSQDFVNPSSVYKYLKPVLEPVEAMAVVVVAAAAADPVFDF